MVKKYLLPIFQEKISIFNYNCLFSIYKRISKGMQITDISLLPQFSATMGAIMQFNYADETISDNIFYYASSIRRFNI